ncbi:MAG: hypothetical protein ACREB6_08695, partial [Rhodospirillales bacterium]
PLLFRSAGGEREDAHRHRAKNSQNIPVFHNRPFASIPGRADEARRRRANTTLPTLEIPASG